MCSSDLKRMTVGACTYSGKKGNFTANCTEKKKTFAETTARPAEVKKVSGKKKKVNKISKYEEDHYGGYSRRSDHRSDGVSTLPEFNDCLANIPKVNVIWARKLFGSLEVELEEENCEYFPDMFSNSEFPKVIPVSTSSPVLSDLSSLSLVKKRKSGKDFEVEDNGNATKRVKEDLEEKKLSDRKSVV